MIKRILFDTIKGELGAGGKNRAILILGARQVGKTTLLNEVFGGQFDVLRLNGDDPQSRSIFEGVNIALLGSIIGDNRFVVIDEAQRVKDIGLKVKLIIDSFSEVRVIATGSSSFELASGTYESLAGRKTEYLMFPLTFGELSEEKGLMYEVGSLENRLVFGSYPDVVTSPSREKEILSELCESILYKDILSYERIKKSNRIVMLLRALAFQIGSQVSYNELANLCGLSAKTVGTYIDILEKSYIIFTLGSYSRNLRNELKFSKKIYFYDNGLRNSIIMNFAPLSLRSDEEKGALWENYVISERMKRNSYMRDFCHSYFWRNTGGQEVDYIEERDGAISAYEFKWNPKKSKTSPPKGFVGLYPECPFCVITPENYFEFLR